MAIFFSDAVRNARLNVFETITSELTPTTSGTATAPILRIYDGTVPAKATSALSGNNVLASITLPTDFMAAASGGSSSKSGTWTDASADATGTATFFRIWNNGLTTAHIQGTVGTSGTDMIVNSTSFVAGNSFTVNTFTLTDGNG
jgi:hypothetical protein